MFKEKYLIFKEAKEEGGFSSEGEAEVEHEDEEEIKEGFRGKRGEIANDGAMNLLEIPEKVADDLADDIIAEFMALLYSEEKVAKLFDSEKINDNVIFENITKLKPQFKKRIEAGYIFDGFSDDGLECYWTKDGKTAIEINPLFRQKAIKEMMSKKGKEMIEKLERAVLMEKVRKFIDKNIISWLKEFRPGTSDKAVYASYLIQQEVMPIVAAGYQIGKPVEFIRTARGFRLKSDIAVFGAHEFDLGDYDMQLNLIVPREKPASDTEAFKEEFRKKYEEKKEETLMPEEESEQENYIDEIIRERFSEEKAAIDNLYERYGSPEDVDPDDLPEIKDNIYGQIDRLAQKNGTIAENSERVTNLLDYFYQATNGGRNPPGSEEEQRRLIEGWPGGDVDELERELEGGLGLAAQRRDYETVAAMQIYSRNISFLIRSLAGT